MKPGDHAATDPVKGLDSNDELAFMAADAGLAAPDGAALPAGIEGVKTVTLADPTNPSAPPTYVYVMRAAADGPKPAYTAANGYVRYERDANADWFAYSQSSYGNYGAARKDYVCDADGNVVADSIAHPVQRRPRDDACFDDGTGSDPGPELHPRHFDQEQSSTASDGSPRRCWDGDPKVPAGDDHFWQGDIGTHGLHLLFLAESDNARLTVPVTEIVSQWQMVMLPGDPGNVGERYGRSFEKPLVAAVQ